MEKDLLFKKVVSKKFTIWFSIWIDTNKIAIPVYMHLMRYQKLLLILCLIFSLRIERNKK